MNNKNKIIIRNLDYVKDNNTHSSSADIVTEDGNKHLYFQFELDQNPNNIDLALTPGYHMFLPFAFLYALQNQCDIYMEGQIPCETMYMLDNFLFPVFARVLNKSKINLEAKNLSPLENVNTNEKGELVSVDLTREKFLNTKETQNLIDLLPNAVLLIPTQNSNNKNFTVAKTHTTIKCSSNISKYLNASVNSINLIQSLSFSQCLSSMINRYYLPASSCIDDYKVDLDNLEKSELLFAHCFTLPSTFIDIFGSKYTQKNSLIGE